MSLHYPTKPFYTRFRHRSFSFMKRKRTLQIMKIVPVKLLVDPGKVQEIFNNKKRS